MGEFNKAAIESFGRRHGEMDRNAPSCDFSPQFAALATYLDCQVLRSWTAHYLSDRRQPETAGIDVGAGKGRMTTQLARIVTHCTAIEPHKPFYDVLVERCRNRDIRVHNCSLEEYARQANRDFDIAWISGVFPYLDDGELREALLHVRGLLAPQGLAINRERGTYGQMRVHEDSLTIDRPPELLTRYAEEAGLKLVRCRRAYPPNPLGVIAGVLPSRRLSNALLRMSFHRATFPFWNLLARCNIRSSLLWQSSTTARYLFYLFKKQQP